tara:strand:+ start:573 stop:2420 length:1848 start_codon:yes stop_codon:yes gene_type:complete
MIRRGGIDSQIEQRKMQFGKNPQALQQRYGQSKQLLDLLALQQIAEEQKQKSQMMQMQMQQNPATIAEQVEQEALQGKKAEMAQSLQGMQAMRAPKRSQSETARGVAGALAQKQREQQSRMRKMAGSGVAGQRARNMERMYDGGIVGFDAGGYTSEELERFREGLARRSGYKTRAADLSEAELARLLAKEPGFLSVMGKKLGALIPDPDPTEIVERYPGRARRILGEDVYAGEKTRQIIDAIPEGRGSTDINELIEQAAAGEIVPPATTDDPPTTTAAPTEPGLMERKAQQKQEILAAGEDILGSPTFGPLKARRSVGVPDLLRAREEPPAPAPAAPAEPKQPSTRDRLQELLDEQFSLYERQKSELDEEQSIFDILTGAARRVGGQKTNRGAAAAFLGGISEEIADEKERKKTGLAKLQERLGTNLSSQLALEQGIAQIERGEALTEQGAEGLRLEAERIGVSIQQLEQAANLAAKELAFKYSKLGADKAKTARMASISEESNKIQREFNNARTEQAKQNLLAKYEQLIFDYDDAIDAALVDEIEAIRIAPNIDAADRPGEIQEARERARKAKEKRRGMLRAMQEQATGVDVDSLRPTVGESVDESVDFGSLPK